MYSSIYSVIGVQNNTWNILRQSLFNQNKLHLSCVCSMEAWCEMYVREQFVVYTHSAATILQLQFIILTIYPSVLTNYTYHLL